MNKNPVHSPLAVLSALVILSCSSGGKRISPDPGEGGAEYEVYIVNKNIHTGIIIPVNEISRSMISALTFFPESEYADFGWGEEAFYQSPGKKYCLGIRAVIIPSSSVMRVEGFSNLLDEVVRWSGYAVRFTLSEREFKSLCGYIDSSFRRGENGELLETSRKRGGEIIFFKSVYRYHLFNTCNTWVARALGNAGLNVSPLLVITSGDLYYEVKDAGTVLKGE